MLCGDANACGSGARHAQPAMTSPSAATDMKVRTIVAKRDSLAAEFIRRAAEEAGLLGESLVHRTAQSALQVLRSTPADLALFGLTFSDMDGLDLVATVIRERLACRILVISTRSDEFTQSQLRAGRINGFFRPELDAPDRLSAAIRRVAAGGTYFTPDPRTKSMRQTVSQMFTPHQIRIFGMLCSGIDEKTAAGVLGLSEHTLHGHAQRIKKKLGVSKLSNLIIEAIRRGVVRVTADDVLHPGQGRG
jgi:DNA-binding NarL/FixJ family response regulator